MRCARYSRKLQLAGRPVCPDARACPLRHPTTTATHPHPSTLTALLPLLQYVDREFLADLSKQNDPDARAVFTRIQTYLKTARFARPPEGRDMPQTDASSYDRA